MRMKINLDDVDTRDLIGWEALHQTSTSSNEDNRGDKCKSHTRETDGKEFTDGKMNKETDGKLKKEAVGNFKRMKSKLQAGE